MRGKLAELTISVCCHIDSQLQTPDGMSLGSFDDADWQRSHIVTLQVLINPCALPYQASASDNVTVHSDHSDSQIEYSFNYFTA